MTLPPILVTGGTGTLGQQVVSRLREAGRDVRVLSRRSRTSQDGLVFATGDLATGEGLPAAVHGVGTIVHCASNRKGDAEATRNLVRAAAQEKQGTREKQGMQGILPHLVYISIVGVDRFPRGYFKTKLEAEGVITDSGLPWTTLRATQFYELIARGAARLAKLPVIPVPAGFVVQPVDSGEVAARLAELALDEPRGRVPDMAGPQILSFADLIRAYLSATGRRPRPGGAGLDAGHRPDPGRRHVSTPGGGSDPRSADMAGLPGRAAARRAAAAAASNSPASSKQRPASSPARAAALSSTGPDRPGCGRR